MITPIRLLGFLGFSNHLPIDAEISRQSDHLGRSFRLAEHLQAVAHIVNLVHFLVTCPGGPLDFLEKGRDGKKVVLYVMNTGAKAQAFGLPSTRAVNQSKNVFPQFFNDTLDHGQVGPGGTEQRLADRKS